MQSRRLGNPWVRACVHGTKVGPCVRQGGREGEPVWVYRVRGGGGGGGSSLVRVGYHPDPLCPGPRFGSEPPPGVRPGSLLYNGAGLGGGGCIVGCPSRWGGPVLPHGQQPLEQSSSGPPQGTEPPGSAGCPRVHGHFAGIPPPSAPPPSGTSRGRAGGPGGGGRGLHAGRHVLRTPPHTHTMRTMKTRTEQEKR